jgi:hypothetical protein
MRIVTRVEPVNRTGYQHYRPRQMPTPKKKEAKAKASFKEVLNKETNK